jgi:2-polyprenyl-6-methoxyphenol hydroxylase-like FAD-dependent oxidoreductase
MAGSYDVIVVGARCAGSPTAMLLARRGYRVLLVDRATFPSDTMSTHMVHPPGVAALERWGLLDDLRRTGCPPITRYAFDFGPFAIAGTPQPVGGVQEAYGPRRIVLDGLLADAAAAAGAELREAFTVDEVLFEDGRVTGIGGHARGGRHVTERARVVIGADGRHSLVAKAVGAARYHERPSLEAGYYAYWSGLETEGFEVFIRPGRAWAAIPTHDDLTCVVVGWPSAEFAANRVDIEGNYLRSVALAPGFAARLEAATRETRFVGTGDLPNWFRRPHGPGWALVGDAGYHKDPCTAQGISDAFRDAEALACALDDAFAGRLPVEHALERYQRERDAAAMPMFELTCDLATLEPPPPEMQQLLGAAHGRREAMDRFVSMMAGTLPVAAFLGADNAERILAEAA